MATHTAQRVAQLAKKLSSRERAAIAEELLAGLDYPGEPVSSDEALEAWRAEVRRRADGIIRGKRKGIPAEDVHARIKRRFSKRS
jgi:putative addiction module component (TIGR02574 family)